MNTATITKTMEPESLPLSPFNMSESSGEQNKAEKKR